MYAVSASKRLALHQAQRALETCILNMQKAHRDGLLSEAVKQEGDEREEDDAEVGVGGCHGVWMQVCAQEERRCDARHEHRDKKPISKKSIKF